MNNSSLNTLVQVDIPSKFTASKNFSKECIVMKISGYKRVGGDGKQMLQIKMPKEHLHLFVRSIHARNKKCLIY